VERGSQEKAEGIYQGIGEGLQGGGNKKTIENLSITFTTTRGNSIGRTTGGKRTENNLPDRKLIGVDAGDFRKDFDVLLQLKTRIGKLGAER